MNLQLRCPSRTDPWQATGRIRAREVREISQGRAEVPHHFELVAGRFAALAFGVNLAAGRTLVSRTPLRRAESSAPPRPWPCAHRARELRCGVWITAFPAD